MSLREKTSKLKTLYLSTVVKESIVRRETYALTFFDVFHEFGDRLIEKERRVERDETSRNADKDARSERTSFEEKEFVETIFLLALRRRCDFFRHSSPVDRRRGRMQALFARLPLSRFL